MLKQTIDKELKVSLVQKNDSTNYLKDIKGKAQCYNKDIPLSPSEPNEQPQHHYNWTLCTFWCDDLKYSVLPMPKCWIYW